MTMDKSKVKQWMMQKFLDWQQSEGERKTVTEFAEYLKIEKTTVTNWLNGHRTPRGVYIDMVAAKLGDEIYDVMGVKKKERSTLADTLYDSLRQEQKQKIDAMVRKFAEQNARYDAKETRTKTI